MGRGIHFWRSLAFVDYFVFPSSGQDWAFLANMHFLEVSQLHFTSFMGLILLMEITLLLLSLSLSVHYYCVSLSKGTSYSGRVMVYTTCVAFPCGALVLVDCFLGLLPGCARLGRVG